MKLYNNNWKFIVYLDTSSYYSKIKTIHFFYSTITNLCQSQTYAKSICNIFSKTMGNKISKLETSSNTLRDLIGEQVKPRVKAGWINIIAFSTIDDLDAERLNYFEKKNG